MPNWRKCHQKRYQASLLRQAAEEADLNDDNLNDDNLNDDISDNLDDDNLNADRINDDNLTADQSQQLGEYPGSDVFGSDGDEPSVGNEDAQAVASALDFFDDEMHVELDYCNDTSESPASFSYNSATEDVDMRPENVHPESMTALFVTT